MRPFSLALCIALGAMATTAWAVSTYTCTTFPVGMGMPDSLTVFPSSINNQAQVAGWWNVPTSQSGFLVDRVGMAIPYAAPAGRYVRRLVVNNVGQVAGGANDAPVFGPTNTTSFISNPDASIILVNPPVDTPAQSFGNVVVDAINDHGDVLGNISVTGQDGIPTQYWFIRDFLGNYTLFDPGVGAQGFGSLNNAGTAVFSDRIRYADGSEKRIPSTSAGYFTWYGINNNGLIIGDGEINLFSFPVVLTPDGHTPAVACPEISGRLTAYSINDNGVIAGEAPPSQTQGTVFLATPTGFHSGATLSNTSWGFSPNPIGQQGGSGTIYVSSSGVADLQIEQIAIASQYGTPADFALTDTTCVTRQGSTQTPGTLAPGQFCAISFTFTPAVAGARKGQLLIFDDAPDAPHVISLDGTGLGKQNLLLSNSSWTFGARPVGDTSGPGILYIYNQGTDAINFASIAITGTNSSDFAISTSTCGSVLAPYTTCVVLFQFTPGSQGLRSAAVTLTDDSPLSPQFIPIRGYGQ